MDEPANRWTFTIGEVFPASCVVSQFVTIVAASLNDLLFVNRLLVSSLRPTAKLSNAGELQYLLRLSAAHLWEFSLTLEEGERVQEIADFLRGLPNEARGELGAVRSLSDVGDDPLKKTVAHVRSRAAFHYEKPGSKWLEKALVKASTQDSSVRFGKAPATIRSEFADEVLVKFLVQLLISDDATDEETHAAIRDLMIFLRDRTSSALRLGQFVILNYFEQAPRAAFEVSGPYYGDNER